MQAAHDPERITRIVPVAGTQPAVAVHPVVVEVMREAGLDLADARPRRLTPELAKDATLLVTMGCGDQCPVVPGLERSDWPLPDPKDRPLSEVRTIRDDIRSRVLRLVTSRGWGPGGGNPPRR